VKGVAEAQDGAQWWSRTNSAEATAADRTAQGARFRRSSVRTTGTDPSEWHPTDRVA